MVFHFRRGQVGGPGGRGNDGACRRSVGIGRIRVYLQFGANLSTYGSGSAGGCMSFVVGCFCPLVSGSVGRGGGENVLITKGLFVVSGVHFLLIDQDFFFEEEGKDYHELLNDTGIEDGHVQVSYCNVVCLFFSFELVHILDSQGGDDGRGAWGGGDTNGDPNYFFGGIYNFTCPRGLIKEERS